MRRAHINDIFPPWYLARCIHPVVTVDMTDDELIQTHTPDGKPQYWDTPEQAKRGSMTEEEVTLQALQQFVETHPERAKIERIASNLRRWIEEPNNAEASRAAIALVGAELAARPSSGETQ